MLTLIERVEVHPASRCTLACDHCQHGSHVLPGRMYAAADYVPHLRILAAFASWGTLNIGGGEPFLHPDLAEFIRECRAVQPCAVDLFTNGFWLLRKDWHEFAAPALALCTHVTISRYPVYVDRLGVAEWDRRIGVLRASCGAVFGTFHPHDPRDLQFTRHDHHETPFPVVTACPMRRCIQLLPSGVLTRCPLGYWPTLIPGVTRGFLEAYDRSGVYDLARGGAGFAEWAGPTVFEACTYCGLATGHANPEAWTNLT